MNMSLLAEMLRDQKITHVMADAEVTYIMLGNGTQVTIRGLVVVEPKQSSAQSDQAATVS